MVIGPQNEAATVLSATLSTVLAMREHFLLDPDLIFLNHGSFGACPRVVIEAQHQILLEIERNPVDFMGRRSATELGIARQAVAQFVGTSRANLVFVENATVGVNILAHSIALHAGDEVLASDHEYGACQEAWRQRCRQTGAVYRSIEITLPFDPEQMVEAFRDAITPATRVLFFSHITSPTALLAHQHGIMVVIDGAHGPGFVDLGLDALNVDFYTGNCHKWMCSPKGAGFVYVRPDRQSLIASPIVSWGQVQALGGDRAALDAFTGSSAIERQLQWLGTRDLSAALSVPAALRFFETHDWWQKRAECRLLAQQFALELAERLDTDPLCLHRIDAQMVAVALPECNGEALRQRLFDAHAIEMPVTHHAGRQYARVSVQAYNTKRELDLLLEVLPQVLSQLDHA
jgi:isopenicillin-N epimerase